MNASSLGQHSLDHAVRLRLATSDWSVPQVGKVLGNGSTAGMRCAFPTYEAKAVLVFDPPEE